MTDWQHWQEPLTTWGVPVFLLLVATWLMLPTLRRRRGERRLRNGLRRAGSGLLEGVVLDDGLDGEAFIDYLLLTPQAIHVLMVQRYQGVVFAAEGMDTWSQVIGQRTYRFANPLPELEHSVMAVRQVVGDVPVSGHIVVPPGVQFPKGRPAAIRVMTKGIRFDAADGSETVPTALRHAWQALRQAVRPLDRQQRRLLQGDNPAPDGIRDSVIALILVLLAGAWLIWRLDILP